MSKRRYNNILELIGNTPIVRINKIVPKNSARYWAKLEGFNPGGSLKDRPALAMIEDAERNSVLKKGYTILEPTSGNMGVSLAMISAVKGYKFIAVMNNSMPNERKKIISALGGEIVPVFPHKKEAPSLCTSKKAQEIFNKHKECFKPDQYSNPINPLSHAKTTAKEIIRAFEDEEIDYLIVGSGTGGTISGTAKVLKKRYPLMKVYAVEPKNSPHLSGGSHGEHSILGLGPGFLPKTTDTSLFDGIVSISDNEAIKMTRLLAKEEGIFVGVSSGAVMAATLQVVKSKNRKKNVLMIFPDSGKDYLNCDVFNNINYNKTYVESVKVKILAKELKEKVRDIIKLIKWFFRG